MSGLTSAATRFMERARRQQGEPHVRVYASTPESEWPASWLFPLPEGAEGEGEREGNDRSTANGCRLSKELHRRDAAAGRGGLLTDFSSVTGKGSLQTRTGLLPLRAQRAQLWGVGRVAG